MPETPGTRPTAQRLPRDVRRRLRDALASAYPWLTDPKVGPTTVDAGECDGCGHEVRLVDTCGPDRARLGRRCAAEAGPSAWCDGHRDDADEALAALERLPDEADDVVRWWWVATGEVQLAPADPVVAQLPPAPAGIDPDELADFR